jgi:hypothetical protein
MPFIHGSKKQKHLVAIADVEYANPDNEKDVLKLYICVPNVAFVDIKLNVSS